MSAGTGAIVIAAARRAERRIVERLRKAGATSNVRAMPLFNVRLLEKRRLQRLIAAGAIREASRRRDYYLDETALDSYTQGRRKRVLVVLGGALLAVLGLFGLTRK